MTVRFTAYIDESGDTGLRGVKPGVERGASEWLVIGCCVVSAENDAQVLPWVKDIRSRFKNSQTPYIHFADLNDAKRRVACETLGSKPCRLFAVMSNKKNVEGYKNQNLNDGNKAWLYWWLCRLLLERVTKFCDSKVPADEKGQWKLRIVFSRRGRMRYIDFFNYLQKLRRQSRSGMLFLKQGDIEWSVIDDEEILVLEHKKRAGLQLADLVASAFFQAVEQVKIGKCNPTYAEALLPRLARDQYGRVLDFGVKTIPSLHEMDLDPVQQIIFEKLGYNKQGW